MTGTQRGNGCSWLDLFGAADAGMACVLLARQGQWGGSARVTARRAVILVGRVPESVSLLCCRTSQRGQKRARGA